MFFILHPWLFGYFILFHPGSSKLTRGITWEYKSAFTQVTAFSFASSELPRDLWSFTELEQGHPVFKARGVDHKTDDGPIGPD